MESHDAEFREGEILKPKPHSCGMGENCTHAFKAMKPKKKLTITLKQGFSVRAVNGQMVIETTLDENEVLDIYAWCEGTQYKSGATFNPGSITFGFPPQILE